MKVPQMDLKRQYLTIKNEIDSAIQHTIDLCAFVAGEKVKQFEDNFAEYCGVKHVVGISCGTSALYVALKTLGIGKGDIVLTWRSRYYMNPFRYRQRRVWRRSW